MVQASRDARKNSCKGGNAAKYQPRNREYRCAPYDTRQSLETAPRQATQLIIAPMQDTRVARTDKRWWWI
jgi:hypothetical protein